LKHAYFLIPLLSVVLQGAFACELSPELELSLATAATSHGLEPALLHALVYQESRYCTEALSPKGAVGLGQLMPGTAQALGVDPHDPEQNLYGAAAYLRAQWETFGDWELALAAYNAGPGAVQKYGGIPPYEETQTYVVKVLGLYGEMLETYPAHFVQEELQPVAAKLETAAEIPGDWLETPAGAGVLGQLPVLEVTPPKPPMLIVSAGTSDQGSPALRLEDNGASMTIYKR
jgi:hypothetical protein